MPTPPCPKNKFDCPVCGRRKRRDNAQTFTQPVTLTRYTGPGRSEPVAVSAGVPVCWSHSPQPAPVIEALPAPA